ncbi:50S ribosomal protein L1 [Rickettsiales endosymbiont of Stachyamoeba lipophora]|uniref:50S ribosomal protein L1 n=1 Tax=Rickettsiales endosymbiont of Stachyamoeba lipophora TaxID=2486578 RepID=UPI000F65266A|nr:50S ribosomal protein L1 [Rickettsiales endosymbiont of Stachyamoeba lipophora]
MHKKYAKKYQAQLSKIDSEKLYTVEEAVKILKEITDVKFDATIDLATRLGIDTRQSDQNLRTVVSLPHGTGKNVKIAVFTKGAKQDEAKKAGADVVGAEELIEQIKQGNINFDICIATPDMMGLLGSVAKVLGPRGLMPNPKLGTVTMDVAKAVNEAKAGRVEIRAEKAGIVHAGVAKVSFDERKIIENVKHMVSSIIKAKPSGAKGSYLKAIYLSSTMSPALRIDISSAAAA